MNEPFTEPSLPCADKLSYDTQSQAQASATALRWQRGIKLKAYRCRHCALWHLSSSV